MRLTPNNNICEPAKPDTVDWKKIKWYKKLWFSLMWPWFDIIGAVSMYIALFKKVTWKPIPHESQVNIDDTEKHISGE